MTPSKSYGRLHDVARFHRYMSRNKRSKLAWVAFVSVPWPTTLRSSMEKRERADGSALM